MADGNVQKHFCNCFYFFSRKKGEGHQKEQGWGKEQETEALMEAKQFNTSGRAAAAGGGAYSVLMFRKQ